MKKEGLGCKVECYGNNMFVSKGGNLELWLEVLVSLLSSGEDLLNGRVWKNNLMGKIKDLGGNKIINLRFGGNKMFFIRKD